MLVEAKGAYTFYGSTNNVGWYSIDLPPDTYEISVIPPNLLWDTCTSSQISVPYYSRVNKDVAVQAKYHCPNMVVNISSLFLRRCFSNYLYVNYSNQGTVKAQNVYIDVELDPHLTFDQSTLPASGNVGNTYTFPIGDVEVGETGSFTIRASLGCNGTVLGQTHCVKAEIYPNETCIPFDPGWDGSITHLEAECQTDSIEFKIKNIGVGDMNAPLDYFVLEDNIVMKNGLFQLPTNQEITFKIPVMTGSTYQLFAEQAPGYFPPAYLPTIAIEGCGSNGGSIIVGLIDQFSMDNASEAISIDCKQNFGSFDPNDKRASPSGYGANHYIEQNIDISYHIRFQNVGNDTAFNIVIRDTLSPHLDPGSIKPSISSFPYSFRIEDNNVLIFSFNDINLVDSVANEPDSHGFVKFTISQKDSVPLGSMIYNSAAIYFDFNEPVITNTTFHEVGRDFLIFPDNQIIVKPRVILQGAYNPITEMMEDHLRANQLIPYQEPYSVLPEYQFPDTTMIGISITDSLIFNKTGPDAIVDWVLIELRDTANQAIVNYAKPALLTRSGKVVDVDGFSPVGFGELPSGTYYLLVRHRNHLPVIRNMPVLLSLDPTYLDFTDGTHTTSQHLFNNGNYALIAGDTNGDFRIDASDRNRAWNGRNSSGYIQSDNDLDGWMTASDRSIIWNNRNIIISID